MTCSGSIVFLSFTTNAHVLLIYTSLKSLIYFYLIIYNVIKFGCEFSSVVFTKYQHFMSLLSGQQSFNVVLSFVKEMNQAFYMYRSQG